MNAVKIYLNENLSWKIAKALREYGYDVVSSHESGMNTENDEVQFAFAVSEKRAVLTNNFSDFISLYQKYQSEGKDHYGIIFTTKYSVTVTIQKLRNLLENIRGEQMRNQIRWLNEW